MPKITEEIIVKNHHKLFTLTIASATISLLWLIISDKRTEESSLKTHTLQMEREKSPRKHQVASSTLQLDNVPLDLTRVKKLVFEKNPNELLDIEHETKPNKGSVNKHASRYNEDPNFNPEMLNGISSESNDFRDEFYAPKIQAILNDQLNNPTGDDTEELVAQFEFVIDYTLGADFPEERRKKIRDGQRKSHKNGKALDAKLEIGLITIEEYDKQESQNHEKDMKELAKILSDEEFEAMLGYPKENIEGAYLRLKAINNDQ